MKEFGRLAEFGWVVKQSLGSSYFGSLLYREIVRDTRFAVEGDGARLRRAFSTPRVESRRELGKHLWGKMERSTGKDTLVMQRGETGSGELGLRIGEGEARDRSERELQVNLEEKAGESGGDREERGAGKGSAGGGAAEEKRGSSKLSKFFSNLSWISRKYSEKKEGQGEDCGAEGGGGIERETLEKQGEAKPVPAGSEGGAGEEERGAQGSESGEAFEAGLEKAKIESEGAEPRGGEREAGTGGGEETLLEWRAAEEMDTGVLQNPFAGGQEGQAQGGGISGGEGGNGGEAETLKRGSGEPEIPPSEAEKPKGEERPKEAPGGTEKKAETNLAEEPGKHGTGEQPGEAERGLEKGARVPGEAEARGGGKSAGEGEAATHLERPSQEKRGAEARGGRPKRSFDVLIRRRSRARRSSLFVENEGSARKMSDIMRWADQDEGAAAADDPRREAVPLRRLLRASAPLREDSHARVPQNLRAHPQAAQVDGGGAGLRGGGAEQLMDEKTSIKDEIYAKKKFVAKQPADSVFAPAHEAKLDRLVENYLYHAFHAKVFVASGDEANHDIKFRDKVTILQSFIDLKIMGIAKAFFEFAVYQTAIEGALTRAQEVPQGEAPAREAEGARERLRDRRV